MTSINIALPESMKVYIEQQIAITGYSTASEYIRDLIYQDQKRHSQVQVETLLLEGLDSGMETPMTSPDWDGIRRAVHNNLAQRNLEHGNG